MGKRKSVWVAAAFAALGVLGASAPMALADAPALIGQQGRLLYHEPKNLKI